VTLQAVQEISCPNFFASDLTETLTLTADLRNLISLSVASATSSTKVWWNSVHWFVRYCAKDARPPHARTHSGMGNPQKYNASANTYRRWTHSSVLLYCAELLALWELAKISWHIWNFICYKAVIKLWNILLLPTSSYLVLKNSERSCHSIVQLLFPFSVLDLANPLYNHSMTCYSVTLEAGTSWCQRAGEGRKWIEYAYQVAFHKVTMLYSCSEFDIQRKPRAPCGWRRYDDLCCYRLGDDRIMVEDWSWLSEDSNWSSTHW